MRTGIANLPLHKGRAPGWLFKRMVRLSHAIIEAFLIEFTPSDFIRRLSDPYWFQSLGSVLGFDWHSSGITTTVMGAIKEATKDPKIPLYVCGGKGRVARNTPDEIRDICDKQGCDGDRLIYASRMSARVDTSALQDGFDIYHHTIIFTDKGNWGVIQQGMNPDSRMARRYHWLGEYVKDFVNQPHTGIISEAPAVPLNLIAKESKDARDITTKLAAEKPDKVVRMYNKIRELNLPMHHPIFNDDIKPENLKRILLKTYEKIPGSFERFLGIEGVGPKTVRALALISDLIFGKSPSFNDPAVYSFAHGGKDGYPYPVDKEIYENSIMYLHRAVEKAKIGDMEKYRILKILDRFLVEGTNE